MTRVEAARPRLDWFGRHFLTGKAQSGWASALRQPVGNREQLSVFELWERKSRRNELCVFWRRNTDDLRDTLRALGLSTQTPLVVGTGHGSDFGVVEMSFDEAF